MPNIRYEIWNPRPEALRQVEIAYSICAEYAAQGFDLTLRQLYYQFVARDLIANSQRSYKNLGSTINRARLSGLLDWDYIVDRTRNLEEMPSWAHPRSVLRSAASSFKLDHWEDQPQYVEVWIEKDALIGVIAPICERLDVPYFSCRGYTSQSKMWNAAQRLISKDRWHSEETGYDEEREITIIHLGDHDPSGIDMTRDIQDRLNLFEAGARVDRVALTMDQIDELSPPPNPTKLTDARAQGYIREYGYQSWELDALEPSYLSNLIETEVLRHRDEDIYEDTIARQNAFTETLTGLTRVGWDALKEFIHES
ncbi:hypothetical protein LCGC14_2033290 [marine sediment metagenome]|uniref:Uncharacterized protein n=1 Tax=marine sediment metagenome TaxID=412755 RepID=A0A0F9H7I8_9ZZZZ